MAEKVIFLKNMKLNRELTLKKCNNYLKKTAMSKYEYFTKGNKMFSLLTLLCLLK